MDFNLVIINIMPPCIRVYADKISTFYMECQLEHA